MVYTYSVCFFVYLNLCPFFSFGMTENYFVFLEQPMYVNVMRLLLNNVCGKPMIKDVFEYDSEEKVNNIEKFLFTYDVLYRTCSWTHRG